MLWEPTPFTVPLLIINAFSGCLFTVCLDFKNGFTVKSLLLKRDVSIFYYNYTDSEQNVVFNLVFNQFYFIFFNCFSNH